MARTYIVHHSENIRDIEDTDDSGKKRKNIVYTSQHKQAVRDFFHKTSKVKLGDGMQLLYSDKYAACQTMGRPHKSEWPVPSQFLRKHGGVKFKRVSDHICSDKLKKQELVNTDASIPTKKESHKLKQKSKKDFIKNNITSLKNLQKRHPPRYVDTEDGRSRLVMPSGLLPTHLCLKTFGKTPCYVKEHKKKLQDEAKECAAKQRQDLLACHGIQKYGVRKIEYDELCRVIEGLKKSYERVMSEFMALPFLMDTEAKRRRKNNLERQLIDIEKDMKLLEKDHEVYVALYD